MIVPLLLSLSLAGAAPSVDGMWGNVGFGMYPADSEKVAPNGLEYKPLFRIVADFNIDSRDLYLFSNSAYYTEKPQPGVTKLRSANSADRMRTPRAWALSLIKLSPARKRSANC